MAAVTGSASTVDGSAASGSASATVPADATAAAAFWSHFDGNGGSTLGSLALGGNAFTTQSELAEGATTDESGVGVAVLVSLPDRTTPTPTSDANLGTNSLDTASNTITLTTAAAAASKSRILLAVHHRDTVGTVFAQSCSGGGLTWDLLTTAPVNGNMKLAWFSAYAPSGLASGTVLTVTFSANVSGNKGVMAASFLGCSAEAYPNYVDNLNFSTGTGTAGWTCDVATNRPNSLVFGVTAIDTSTSPSNTPSVGTEVHDFFGAGNRAYATEYAVPASPTTQTISGTWSGLTGASTKVTSLVALKAATEATLSWSWSAGGARSEGGGIIVVWVKGVDTSSLANLVIAAATNSGVGGTTVPVSVATVAGCLPIGFAQSFGGDPALTGADVILVDNYTQPNGEHYDVGYSTSFTNPEDFNASAFDYSTAAAISLRNAPAGVSGTANQATETDASQTVSPHLVAPPEPTFHRPVRMF